MVRMNDDMNAFDDDKNKPKVSLWHWGGHGFDLHHATIGGKACTHEFV